MFRAWMRREHWLIWLTAIVVLTMAVATIGYFTLAHLTVAVASTGVRSRNAIADQSTVRTECARMTNNPLTWWRSTG